MPYSYTLSTMIPARPVEIYQAWLDSIAHSEMTGGEAVMSDEVGADISAWDGYITGRNLELVPGERIVQSWRTTEFDDEQADSIVTILLKQSEDGTLLTLEHSNVPDEHKSYEEGGWQSNYFEPMVVYFSDVKKDLAQGGLVVSPPQEAAPEPVPAAKKASGPPPRKARAAKRRATASAARRARPAAGTKRLKSRPKAAARRAKAGKKAASAAAKKTATKSSHGRAAKRGAAKTAARAAARRKHKPARGRRR
jgi:uncharacterized protein YndB with AHSA1/START domain